MAFTVASGGPIEGTLWRDGVVPAIPGIFEFTRLAVGENGERRAAIFVPPQDGPAFALPSLDLMFTEPGLYIPKADGDRIHGVARRREGGAGPTSKRSAGTSRGSPTRT